MVVILFMLTILILSGIYIGRIIIDNFLITNHTETISETLSNGSVINKLYLTPNPYSRPQKRLKHVKGLVIHYTANPGTSAKANRNYFESLARKETVSASSHYIVGLEGEVVQCMPLTEIAYATKQRNIDTISIEVCHEDKSGKFNEKSYEALVALAAALCKEYGLSEKDIIRHYDVTGKPCPLYYVEHEDEWLKLKHDIKIR